MFVILQKNQFQISIGLKAVEKREKENIPKDRDVFASRASFIIDGCQVHRLAYGVRCDGGVGVVSTVKQKQKQEPTTGRGVSSLFKLLYYRDGGGKKSQYGRKMKI